MSKRISLKVRGVAMGCNRANLDSMILDSTRLDCAILDSCGVDYLDYCKAFHKVENLTRESKEPRVDSSVGSIVAESNYRPTLREGFALLEVVFSLLVLGVAFSLLAHFYLSYENAPRLELEAQDNAQERAFRELESKLSPTSHIINGTKGEFCEGHLLQSVQGQSVFKAFKPLDCDDK